MNKKQSLLAIACVSMLIARLQAEGQGPTTLTKKQIKAPASSSTTPSSAPTGLSQVAFVDIDALVFDKDYQEKEVQLYEEFRKKAAHKEEKMYALQQEIIKKHQGNPSAMNSESALFQIKQEKARASLQEVKLKTEQALAEERKKKSEKVHQATSDAMKKHGWAAVFPTKSAFLMDPTAEKTDLVRLELTRLENEQKALSTLVQPKEKNPSAPAASATA